MDVQTDRLMRQAEVAELIGMSEAWLEQCRFRRTGINFIKVGRSVRYRYEDVMSWLESQTTICE
jgi:predicted DNA-binding transcriptional regulator AlpA